MWPLGSATGFIPLIFAFDFTGNFEAQLKGTQFLCFVAFTCGMGLRADTASPIQVHLAEKENIVM